GSARSRGIASIRSASTGSVNPATSRSSTAPMASMPTASSVPRRALASSAEGFRLFRRRDAHRGGVAVELHPLPSIDQLSAVDLEDRHVAIDEIAGVEVLAVGAECDRFGQAADL